MTTCKTGGKISKGGQRDTYLSGLIKLHNLENNSFLVRDAVDGVRLEYEDSNLSGMKHDDLFYIS